jgi:hypothetical protein
MYVSLYVIPGDCEPNIDKAVTSFGKSLLTNVVVCDSREPRFQEAQGRYFAYMYADEWCSDSLKAALPVFFNFKYWTALSLFRRILSENKFFIAPRIFKSGTEMAGLMPKYPTFLTYEKVLNGFLLRR